MSLFHFPKITVSRGAKVFIGLAITLIAAGSILAGIWYAWNKMFKGNNRFLVTKVVVISTGGHGKWHGKSEDVKPMLKVARTSLPPPDGVVPPEQSRPNLFEIDLLILRNELQKVAEIESAEVRRILPDTLEIKITERIPVAILQKKNSIRVIDRHGVVVLRHRCVDISGTLPVLKNFKTPVPNVGTVFEELKPALAFIQLTKVNRAYSKLRIQEIDLSKENYFRMVVTYNENPADYYIVSVPVNEPEKGLDRILTSIEECKKIPASPREIDLRYDGQSVLRLPNSGAKK